MPPGRPSARGLALCLLPSKLSASGVWCGTRRLVGTTVPSSPSAIMRSPRRRQSRRSPRRPPFAAAVGAVIMALLLLPVLLLLLPTPSVVVAAPSAFVGLGPQRGTTAVTTSPGRRPRRLLVDKLRAVSAAAGERREEERRREERKNEVVVGQTSAVPDAKDYTIDPSRTEGEYLRAASEVEREVHVQTDRGMECLRMLRLEEAREAFAKVHALRPDAYVSQSGVVMYYLDDVHAASVRFARDARLYENRFGGVASEERIWRDACYLRLLSGLPRKDRRRAMEEAEAAALRAALEEEELSREDDEDGDDDDDVPQRSSLMPIVPSIPPPEGRETRKVLRIAGDLFDASVSGDPARVVLARARLRAIAEAADDVVGSRRPAVAETTAARRRRMRLRRGDPMQRRLSSWYYLGLHHDALGESEESRRCMKNALGLSGGTNHGDVLHCLPVIHMARRDWFDDEAMAPPPLGVEGDGDDDDDDDNHVFDLAECIRDGIENMTAADITDALKKRGLKSSGSKIVLQERLFDALWNEVDEEGCQ